MMKFTYTTPETQTTGTLPDDRLDEFMARANVRFQGKPDMDRFCSIGVKPSPPGDAFVNKKKSGGYAFAPAFA